ncbi:MAG TPA: SRPBCC family protein [Myxococcaceae bacterium]|nr:SRPBCC family protein [Myxococcaceae bacterium]
MADTVPDRIEKQILLRAPRSRVWRALTDAREFSAWFRVNLVGEFRAGERITGPITYPGYQDLTMEAWVERMEPETLFSFRWHPFAIERGVDYSKEPTTTVEFQLEEVPGGTLLKVVESGFDQLPAARRSPAHKANSSGWEEQLRNIEQHVAEHPSPRG